MLNILKTASVALRNEQVKIELIDEYQFPDYVVEALPKVISDTYQHLGEQLQAYSIESLATV